MVPTIKTLQKKCIYRYHFTYNPISVFKKFLFTKINLSRSLNMKYMFPFIINGYIKDVHIFFSYEKQGGIDNGITSNTDCKS